MHFNPPAEHTVPRSKLGATLLRLHKNLEASRQREQAALDLFETWQSRWADHRSQIAQRLTSLDRELADMSASEIPSPHLSLLALSESADEEMHVTSVQPDEDQGVPAPKGLTGRHVLWQET